MKKFLIALALLFTGVSFADTIAVPAPDVIFLYNSARQTIAFALPAVDADGNATLVTYIGPNAYTTTLVLHNVYGNYEAIRHFEQVVLTAADGSTALFTGDADYHRTLNRSGHNFYVFHLTLLSGELTTP